MGVAARAEGQECSHTIQKNIFCRFGYRTLHAEGFIAISKVHVSSRKHVNFYRMYDKSLEYVKFISLFVKLCREENGVNVFDGMKTCR